MQETHLTPELFHSFERKYDGHIIHSPGTSNSRGVAVLFHSSFQFKLLNVVSDEVGRYIIASIETDKECYTLVNIYAPNDQNLRNSFFKHINEKLSECSTGSIIVGGDFNEVLNPAIDRRSRCRNIPKKTKASSCISKMNKNHDLVDIWRVKNKKNLSLHGKDQAYMKRVELIISL